MSKWQNTIGIHRVVTPGCRGGPTTRVAGATCPEHQIREIAHRGIGTERAPAPRPMRSLAILVSIAICASCASDDTANIDDEWGMDGPMQPTPPPGKEDSELRRGLLVNTDTTRTQVWTARN